MLAQHPLHSHQWGAFVRWLLPESKVPSAIVSTESQFHYNQKPVDCIETITTTIIIVRNYACYQSKNDIEIRMLPAERAETNTKCIKKI